MASNTGPHANRISPRKFSEKIALLNKKEREANAKFEEIIKEVQATRSQPQQPAIDSTGNPTSQLIADELQSMIESTRHQAAHSDSLEEIEKVYENLMRCVGGQGDFQNAPAGQRALETSNKCYPGGQQQFISVEQGLAGAKSGASRTAPTLVSMTATSIIPAAPAAPYYQPQANNGFQSTTIDLNSNSNSNSNRHQGQEAQHQQVSQSVGFIPCEPIIDANHFATSHNPVEARVSSSYLPPTRHDQGYLADSQTTRARVVSFGSASRQKYRCAATNYQPGKAQAAAATLACDQSHPYQLAHHQYQTQYLKEPSGDRSRQKSSSDPQLHLAQAAQCSGSINPRELADCQALETQTADNTHAGIVECCNGQDHFRKSHQANERPQYKREYAADIAAQSLQHLQSAARSQQHRNQAPVSSVADPDCNHGQVSTSSQLDNQRQQHQQQRQFTVCDTTNTRGELPNIKICAIEDNEPACTRMILEGDSQNDVINSTAPSSRDGSLPDISNLQFGNNSAGTSPERHVYQAPKDWPTQSESCYSMGQMNAANMGGATAASESCQALDGSWMSYECAIGDGGGGAISMDAQSTTNQPNPLSGQSGAERQPRRDGGPCWSGNTSGQPRETLKADNQLSHSDCGFGTSSNNSHHHHQQGNLMICTSSDLYNNIFRSHSHSNIDYLAKQNNAKRAHLYADNNLQQFEEHHTSQYCLQTADQPAMNVRRIAELKAQGTSTSPLNSSSNLNSPQSEMNSPGSSTTEQCESTMIFANTPAQQDFYPAGPMPGANGAPGLAPDEPLFVQYAHGDATMIDSSQEQQEQQRQALSSNEPVNQCFQSMQTPAGEGYIVQQEAQPQHQRHGTATPCSHGLYNGAISPPSSTTAFVNNEDNNNSNSNNQRTD